MVFCVLLLVGTVLGLFVFYKWVNQSYSYFEKRGQPFAKPYFLLGNNVAMTFGQQNVSDFIKSIYNDFPNEK